nr:hypothetical protein [Tanacetum cinerariifolium]
LISITLLSNLRTLFDKWVHKSINSLSFKLSLPPGSGSLEGKGNMCLGEGSREGTLAYIDEDVEINLEEAQAKPYRMELQHQENVLSMLDVIDEEPDKVEEVLEVVTVAKLITKVVTTTGATTTAEAVKIEQDEAFTRQLEEELNANINWNAVIEQVKISKRLSDAVIKYQALKRKPFTEAQARSHLKIVSNDDDDVYIEATPLASKIPIVDYKIHFE